jgi:hypothetical protein
MSYDYRNGNDDDNNDREEDFGNGNDDLWNSICGGN